MAAPFTDVYPLTIHADARAALTDDELRIAELLADWLCQNAGPFGVRLNAITGRRWTSAEDLEWEQVVLSCDVVGASEAVQRLWDAAATQLADLTAAKAAPEKSRLSVDMEWVDPRWS